jgi:hypothetical protein
VCAAFSEDCCHVYFGFHFRPQSSYR